jgi:hypothetical protein
MRGTAKEKPGEVLARIVERYERSGWPPEFRLLCAFSDLIGAVASEESQRVERLRDQIAQEWGFQIVPPEVWPPRTDHVQR